MVLQVCHAQYNYSSSNPNSSSRTVPLMLQVCDATDHPLMETETSFSICLRTLSWLPAIQYDVTDSIGSSTPGVKTTLMPPSCLYVASPELQRVLAHTAMYLDASLIQGSSFCEFLRLKTSVSPTVIKDLLLQWSARKQENSPGSARKQENSPATFCTFPHHMTAVYRYLSENLTRKDLQDLVHDNPVIWVPEQATSQPGKLFMSGKMLHRREVWWADHTGLFHKHAQILKDLDTSLSRKHEVGHIYGDNRDMATFFTQDVRVQKHPTIVEYAELLVALTSSNTAGDLAAVSDIRYLYEVIGEMLTPPRDGEEDAPTRAAILDEQKKALLLLLRKQKVFITTSHKRVSLDEHPIIPDNADLERIFQHKSSINLLELDDESKLQRGVSRSQSKCMYMQFSTSGGMSIYLISRYLV
jgi:hypothetical protein